MKKSILIALASIVLFCFSKTQAQDKLSSAVVRDKIKKQMSKIKECQQHLPKDGKKYNIQIKFTIHNSGEVTDVHVANDINPDITQCLMKAFGELTYPPFEGKPLTINYPVIFQTTSSQDEIESPEDESDSSPPSQKCIDVINIAEKHLKTLKPNAKEYQLIEVKNLVIKGSDYAGPHLWRVTYKLKKLIPEDKNAAIGAGGEIFMTINLETRKVEAVSYGE